MNLLFQKGLFNTILRIQNYDVVRSMIENKIIQLLTHPVHIQDSLHGQTFAHLQH